MARQADGTLPVPTEVEDLVREGVLHPFDVDLEDARADTVESRQVLEAKGLDVERRCRWEHRARHGISELGVSIEPHRAAPLADRDFTGIDIEAVESKVLPESPKGNRIRLQCYDLCSLGSGNQGHRTAPGADIVERGARTRCPLDEVHEPALPLPGAHAPPVPVEAAAAGNVERTLRAYPDRQQSTLRDPLPPVHGQLDSTGARRCAMSPPLEDAGGPRLIARSA